MGYSSIPFRVYGATVHISDDIPATEDQAGYEDVAVVYTAIGEIGNIGNTEEAYNLITYDTVEDGIVKKLKGAINYGSTTIEVKRVYSDAGQVLLETAKSSTANYTFKITLSDGTKIYFMGKVMSESLNLGDKEVVSGEFTVELDSVPVRVAGS